MPKAYRLLFSVPTAMNKNSIRNIKNSRRTYYRQIRASLSESSRQEYSRIITEKIISSDLYRNTDVIFTYVSFSTEPETRELIRRSLENGKKTAVPYCIPETSIMKFYYIESEKNLRAGSFGIYEPVPEECEEATEKSGIIIVPGLAFDVKGYRTGYGKGFYDRYLPGFQGEKIGICYSSCMRKCILHDTFDVRVNYIITEKFTKFIAK